ncbi:hypothetical protein L6164_030199 [Bauhinia variegata]|uniref:Uncharacterized protein n=1 Tax=Bauhinia variegata TaxID=167791 RepID=A0ACB9LB57_BAUVA|nr:hypothetical protein L6164_030199 [Bauhinia variegata]
MGRHQQPETEQQNCSKIRPNKRKRIMVYCCCPVHAMSSMFRGIGRCMFVSCYPVLRCTGLDDYRHRHHDHHKHFDW